MRMSFKIKVIALFTIMIVIIFIIIAITFTLTRANELKKDIISSARMYVQLTNDKIGDAFIRYYKTGFFKFREIVLHQIGLSSDLKHIQIIDFEGTIYFDSQEIGSGRFFLAGYYKCVTDSFILQNTKKMEAKQRLRNDLTIISPYTDEYGVHRFSIVYYFSLERLAKGIATLQRNTVLLYNGIVLIGFVISILFANQITRHLARLRNAAKLIAAGDFTKIVTIKTNDEFEDLAKVFNFMTEEIRRNVRELKNLVKELKKRDEQKTQFLANLSHELRTPLTASLGYVDYLQKGKLGTLSEAQLRSLGIIKRNLERLNNEIHSLLQISKYTLEGIKLQPQKVSINEIIKPIINTFKPDIENKKLNINFDFRVDYFYADKDYLRTVFENLIGNAVKFSGPSSGIKISTDRYTEDNKKYTIVVVSDQGIGIPQKRLKKIFEPFYQVDTSTTRKYSGIGLGLSIARSIVEAHNGRIWAESEKNGTTFKFIIPYEE